MNVEQALMALDRYILRRWREMPEELRSLTPTEYDYLTTVEEMSPVRLSDLAASLQVSKPTASTMINRLLRKELINKRPCPDDGRSALLLVSSKAESILKMDKTFYHEIIGDLLTDFSEENQQQLEVLLTSMVTKSEVFTRQSKPASH